MEVKKYLNQLGNELHRKAISKFETRKVVSNYVDQIWSADLNDLSEWSNKNNGYKYLLTNIDIYSRYAWVKPLKSKSAEDVLEAFKQIIKESKSKPDKLWVDEGKEFYNNKFNKFLKSNKIEMYSSHGKHKAMVIERFNRTLKEKMWKYFTISNTRKWYDKIEELTNDYNNTIHRTLKFTPNEVREKNIKTIYDIYPSKEIKPKFKIGDYVRISRIKSAFEKGYYPNWSHEIYIINKVKNTDPITYEIKDWEHEKIKGSFYEQELQKTELHDMNLVEETLGEKKIKGKKWYLVKFLGYPSSFNKWLPESDFMEVPE